MPVRGTTVLPSPETQTPPVPIGEREYLTPDDFGIPHKRCFTPTELAPYFYVSPDTIARMIEDGLLMAITLRAGGPPKIPYASVAAFFAAKYGAMN